MKTLVTTFTMLFFAIAPLAVARKGISAQEKAVPDRSSSRPPTVVGPVVSTDFFNDPAQFPARGEGVDWGLALSGGGIRAAAFSIGVMKAFHDNGLLNDIDVISSVSGGGYASYWLLTNYHANSAQPFGAAAFANDVFLRNVCELQRTADFIKVTGALPVFFRSRKKSLEYYEERIQRSFVNPRVVS